MSWTEPFVRAWIMQKAKGIAELSDGELREEFRDYRSAADSYRLDCRTLDQLEEWELYNIVTAALLEQEGETRRRIEGLKGGNVKK